MEERDYYIILYDFYGELFSEKHQEYFEDYYFNNLSLSEISENINISRNAIHKTIKSIEKKLLYYEEKLSLYKKSQKINKIINEINNEKIKKELEDIIYE